ncbi:hypothetical protein TGPRC2_423020, partial [Toxoplasma gondii TgCatPRC2]
RISRKRKVRRWTVLLRKRGRERHERSVRRDRRRRRESPRRELEAGRDAVGHFHFEAPTGDEGNEKIKVKGCLPKKRTNEVRLVLNKVHMDTVAQSRGAGRERVRACERWISRGNTRNVDNEGSGKIWERNRCEAR